MERIVKIVLDTCALIWWSLDPNKLTSAATRNKKFLFRCYLGIKSEELGVRSEELGVRSEELGVRSEELGVRS